MLYTILIITHIIGVSLGVGGATISDVLFFKALKKKKIESAQFDFFKKISSVVWTGFIILVFSGVGFFIVYRLNFLGSSVAYSPRLWAHITVALAVLFNGLAMHWKVFPLLESCINKPLFSGDFLKKSPTVFSTGAISIVSWYFALILGAWHGLNLSYLEIITVYFAVILIAVIIANIIGKKIINS